MKEFFHYILMGQSYKFSKISKNHCSAPLRDNEKILSYLYSAHQVLKYAKKNFDGRGSIFLEGVSSLIFLTV
jgi:hypothetical protein